MNVALVLIDIQKGFTDPYWGKRNNPCFECNVQLLLEHWRRERLPIFHVRHRSTELGSPLRPDQSGVDFMDFVRPETGEPIFTKSVHSAFIQTGLESALRRLKLDELVLVGLTSDHCVSTSARMGADLGFKIWIPSDAVATFNRFDAAGNSYPAEQVQAITLASLHQEFATVSTAREILERISEPHGLHKL